MKGALAVMLMCVVLAGCVPITQSGQEMEYVGDGVVQLAVEMETDILKVMVKGSIYETGEQVSVFGTCLNATDGGINGSMGYMSAWYPNGTVFFENVTMMEVEPGYFLYSGPMDAVPGTYLTEFECVLQSGARAKAFGEWQNPQWVRKIGQVNDTVSNLYNETQFFQNLSLQWYEFMMGQMANLTVQVNQTYVNVTEMMVYVAGVANASVDREDSYLADLLEGVAVTVGAPITGNLSIEEDYESARYLKKWRIEAIVRNEYNTTVGYPPVRCLINTTNVPATENVEMTFEGNEKTLLFDQQAKNHYSHEEVIKTRSDFTWTIWCEYITP